MIYLDLHKAVTKPDEDEGESFGKPVSEKAKEDPNTCMSEEISHLIKDKGYSQKRAVAAAYSICDHPKSRTKKGLKLYLRLE